jgi:ribonuclease HII
MPGTDSLFSPAEFGPNGPDFSHEARLLRQGRRIVAGIDEAGRGPLAGPVVAAAVVLDPKAIPAGLNDSKKIPKTARERLFAQICASATVSWCTVPADAIDRINIREATLLAMTNAAMGLPILPDACLIDGRDVPLPLRDIGRALVGGDRHSQSIAAASIVAKVVRDAMMAQADHWWPDYGFAHHSGYGTAQHLEALVRHGPCPLHRRSFAPIRQMLEEQPEKERAPAGARSSANAIQPS